MKKKKSGSSKKNPTSKNSLPVVKDSLTTDKSDKIIIYTDDKGNTELRADVEKETVWATQMQIADIFGCSIDNVSLHIKNIFKSRELREKSVIEESSATAKDGKRYLTIFYNLDLVIAVGYRVNSKKATKFRIWATKILREYIVSGYSLNRSIVAKSPEKIEGLQEAIALIESTDNPGKLKGKIIVKLTKNLESK